MSTATDSSPSTDLESRDWLELPDDVTARILQKLPLIEIIESAPMVCHSWRRVTKDPSMWRRLDINILELRRPNTDWHVICRNLVNRSDGQLNELTIGELGADDDLLQYIVNRSSGLKCLRLASCFCITQYRFIEKLRLLEELELTDCMVYSEKVVEAIGKSCCLLNSFKLNRTVHRNIGPCDDEALAIAENMSGLRHLELIGNDMSDNGLRAILNGCPLLESLDLRQCNHLCLEGDLKQTCIDQVKSVKLPDAPMDEDDDVKFPDFPDLDDDFYEDDDDDYEIFENYYDD